MNFHATLNDSKTLGRAALCLLFVFAMLMLMMPQAQALSPYEEELLTLINAERTRNGLEPLVEDVMLTQAARIRAREATVRFSHSRPDKTEWKTVFEELGIHAQERGENLAMQQELPEEVFASWMKSKNHRENMLNPNYTHAGVSYAEADGDLYWSLLVILPEDAPAEDAGEEAETTAAGN